MGMTNPWDSPITIELTRHHDCTRPGRASLARSASLRPAQRLRLRPGAYVNAAQWRTLFPAQAHRVRVIAALQCGDLHEGAALARESAAVMHGIPVLGALPDQVQLIRPGRRGGRLTPTTRTLTAPAGVALGLIGSVSATTPAQTLVDLARRRDLRTVLPGIDFALRTGMTSKAEMLDLLATQRSRAGNAMARHAIEHGDERSESPGESLSRAVMIDNAIPLPDLQHTVISTQGEIVGRVDFVWWDHGVIGEFDGDLKYTRELAGSDPQGVVVAERKRERAVERETGMRVARWTWNDAWNTDGLLRELASYGITPRP